MASTIARAADRVSAQRPPASTPVAQVRSSTTGANYARFRATKYFASLDGLRCLSILAVIWHHTADGWPWLPVSDRGFLGVDMFFVLSGFLIVTLLLRENDQQGAICLRNFYVRRSLRIFPVYYALVLGLAAVYFYLKSGSTSAGQFFHSFPYYLTYTSNWIVDASVLAVAWSLAAEEQFYVAWPPIEKFLGGWRALALMGLFILANQAVNFGFADGLLDAWGLEKDSRNILQITFTPICLGVLLAHALHAERGYKFLSSLLGSRWAAPVAAAMVLALVNVPGDLAGTPRLAIQMGMAALLAACVLREDHVLQGALTWSVAKRIGAISYGMYLYHMFARQAVAALLNRFSLNSTAAMFLLTLVVTFVVADVSFRWFETPFLRQKSRFESDRGHRPAAKSSAEGSVAIASPLVPSASLE